MHQYAQGITVCTPDTLLKAAGVLPELSLQERPLDAALELLKTDRLDENCSTEGNIPISFMINCMTVFSNIKFIWQV